jgi:hypothetical protein
MRPASFFRTLLTFLLMFVATTKLLTCAAQSGVLSQAPIPEPANFAANNKNNSDHHDDDVWRQLPPGEDPENQLSVPFAKHLMKDQENFWSAPHYLRIKDFEWIGPLAGLTAALVASDSWISKQIPTNYVQRSKTASNFAAYSLVGLSAGSFLWGWVRSNDHLSEAGLLSGEAALNSIATSYFLKETFRRERPSEGSEHGSFFQGGS